MYSVSMWLLYSILMEYCAIFKMILIYYTLFDNGFEYII